MAIGGNLEYVTDASRMDRPDTQEVTAAQDLDVSGVCGCARIPTTAASGNGEHPASAWVCAPCVASPSSLPERLERLRTVIATESEPLVALTHLLQLCRDEHPVLWERLNEPITRGRGAEIVVGVVSAMPVPSTVATLCPEVRRALVDALNAADQVPVVVVARALAELIDERYAESLAASFRRRSPYQPGVGDPVPMDSPDLREVTELPTTAPPWRLANRMDETRHVRLAGEWALQFRVIFDYSLAGDLAGLIGPDTIIATCHPNRTLSDLDFPLDDRRRTFGVRPVDEPRQRRVVDGLIASAVTAGASIVVLPELCVTESLAAQLQDWTCRADGPRLLLAGTYHHDDQHPDPYRAGDHDRHPGPTRRRNTAVAYLRGCPTPLTHDKHSPADRPVNEDIQPQGWPQLRVYVSDDGWHLVIAICRDLLNPNAVHALAEAGVNLVLVPAMSETLVAFGGPVAHLVGSTQAFVAVANNPADFSEATGLAACRPARALFGHPGFGQQTRLVQPAGDEPGVALLRLRTGQVQWLSATPAPVQPASKDDDTPLAMLPPWATRLANRSTTPRQRQDQLPTRITLRPAAALVLLTDSEAGPAVLLTQRASDLTHYPGQWVFPGGASEPDDDGPVGTALREAAEEVGLDPDSVQILGVLPAVALPDSGFLLSPVLAWSPRPVVDGATNLAEVSALTTIPVRLLARPDPLASPGNEGAAGVAIGLHLGGLGAATRVLIDLLNGMLAPSTISTEARQWPT